MWSLENIGFNTPEESSKNPIVKAHLNEFRIEWKFISPRAPWHGGFWKQMVGRTKSSLKKVFGRALVSLSELQTIVVKIESRINDRLLTYASDDSTDLQPLSPSQLLYGYRLAEIPDPVLVENVLDPTYQDRAIFTKRHMRCNLLLQYSWARWHHEYLAALRERKNLNSSNGRTCAKCDIVLVLEGGPRLK